MGEQWSREEATRLFERVVATVDAGGSVQAAMADLDRLSADRADDVLDRLDAILPLLSTERRRGDVLAAAEVLGMSRRNVHVLVKRLRSMPPVEAMTPRAGEGRSTRPPSRPVDARMAIVDEAIRGLLDEDRVATLARARRRVAQVAMAAGVDPPAGLTVARRLARLRTESSGSTPIGARVLFATSPVAALVATAAGPSVPLVVALIVDVEAGLVLGRGAAPTGREIDAVDEAARSFGMFSEMLRFRREVAPALLEFEADVRIPSGSFISFGTPRGSRGRLARMGLKRALGASPGAATLRPRWNDAGREVARGLDADVLIDGFEVRAFLDDWFGSLPLRRGESTASRPDALDEARVRIDVLLKSVAEAWDEPPTRSANLTRARRSR